MPRAKLTEKYIERIPYSEKTVEYYDTKLTGFGVRVGSSSKTYFVKGRNPDGSQFKRKLGKFGLTHIDDAVSMATSILQGLEQGIGPDHLPAEPVPQEPITLKMMLAEYLLTRKRLKPSTRELYKTLLNRYLPDWLDLPMKDISPVMVVKRHAEIGAKSPAGADGTFRVVRALYNLAIDIYDQEITRSPVKRLSSTKAWYRVPRKERFIKPSQLAIFFGALRESPCLVSDYLEALLFTGIRSASEIARLQIKHVDFKDRAISLYDTKTKGYQYVPVSETTITILKRRADDARAKKTPYLFYAFQEQAARNGAWIPKPDSTHIKDVRGTIKSILSGTVLADITPHDLRRSFLTYADELEISNVVQKALVGHAIPTDVTDGYKIITMDRLRKAVDRVEGYILQHAGLL